MRQSDSEHLQQLCVDATAIEPDVRITRYTAVNVTVAADTHYTVTLNTHNTQPHARYSREQISSLKRETAAAATARAATTTVASYEPTAVFDDSEAADAFDFVLTLNCFVTTTATISSNNHSNQIPTQSTTTSVLGVAGRYINKESHRTAIVAYGDGILNTFV